MEHFLSAVVKPYSDNFLKLMSGTVASMTVEIASWVIRTIEFEKNIILYYFSF